MNSACSAMRVSSRKTILDGSRKLLKLFVENGVAQTRTPIRTLLQERDQVFEVSDSERHASIVTRSLSPHLLP